MRDSVTMSTRPEPILARRRARQRAAEDPRAWSSVPNVNPTLGSVGPLAAGAGTVTLDPTMIPAELRHAQAWSGWVGDWSTPYLEPAGVHDWSGFGYGRHAGTDAYLGRVSTVMTAVDLNTRQIASFPVYALRNGLPARLPEWARSSPEPSTYETWGDFMKAAANTYQLRGEAIVWIVGRYARDDMPARFVVLNPDVVNVESDGEGGWNYSLGSETLDRRDIVHVRYQTLPMRGRGVGPLEWCATNLVGASALEAYAADIATSGVWAVIRHPASLDKTQADDLKMAWMMARRSSGGAPAVLSGGVEFDTVSLSPKDMALLDLRTFDEQRIASAFGVPPFLIGLPQPSGLTYATATGLFDYHWRATLRPMAQTFSDVLSARLLPRGTRLEYNPDRYVEPPLGDRANAYATLHGIEDADGNPALTVDEIRVAERYRPYGSGPEPSDVPTTDRFADALGLAGVAT